ncbi:retropepsin-like aspartic protease [Bacteroides sp.]|uniref:retropepsin-like aspartic protease n=1 Tax=Bacteroides sp. TaxID=29523 RepID=UPI0023BD6A9E|nr:retropepsin-like aspartic protease [Bacteroides sp.]MDE6215127.1 retropepsin-like domain-containing protein [Bacteroides sp.]
MRITNRLSFLLITFLLGYSSVYSQTQADVKMGEILNSGDLFQLRKEYPNLKDSVSVKMLNFIADAQLGIGFNKLENAAVALDSLLLYHQNEMGAETSIGMAALQGMNLLNLGMYEQAGEIGEDLVNALKESVPFEKLYSFVFIEKVGKALANVPKPYLERPNRDVIVPLSVETIGRGKHVYIPVEVNGITKNYIFDTGCSFGNFVSEKYAEEVGLKIITDSIPVSGMEIGFVKLASANSLKIGELVYHNPVFMVAPLDNEVDSVFTFDGVLGYHFIRDAKEIIIDNEASKFVFPQKLSEGEPNMYLSSNTPQVRICYNGQPFDLIFDTGNVKTDLGNKFAITFPDAIEGLAEQTTSRGGFGGISQTKAVTLPRFCFEAAGSTVTLHDTEVIKNTDFNSQLFSGSLGVDFVLAFKRLVINYQNMFICGE